MYLLDTNVVSEIRKVPGGRADENVAAWTMDVAPASLFISVITVMEIEIGVILAERRDPSQGAVFRTWFSEYVLPVFHSRILPVNADVARRCAALHVPNPRPDRDTLIAATALINGLTVVTRNVRDFTGTGVDVFNPWEYTR